MKNNKKLHLKKCWLQFLVIIILFFLCLAFVLGSDLILDNPSNYEEYFSVIIFQYENIVLTRFEFLYIMKISFVCIGISAFIFFVIDWCFSSFKKAYFED